LLGFNGDLNNLFGGGGGGVVPSATAAKSNGTMAAEESTRNGMLDFRDLLTQTAIPSAATVPPPIARNDDLSNFFDPGARSIFFLNLNSPFLSNISNGIYFSVNRR
jgi:hypothetical protein